MKTNRRYATSILLFLFSITAPTFASDLDDALKPGLDAITPDGLLAHIKVLSSDEYEGRAPGTKGEDLSVSYITDQFRKNGLKPAIRTGVTHRRFRSPALRVTQPWPLPSATKRRR